MGIAITQASILYGESNEEFGQRLSSYFRQHREQVERIRTNTQRSAQVYAFDAAGERRSVGSWDTVRTRKPSDSGAVTQVSASRNFEAEADAASAKGDYDTALRLLGEALGQSPGNAKLINMQSLVANAKMVREIYEANSMRGVELKRVLTKAEQTLATVLKAPSPMVALAGVVGDPITDPMVVDLTGAHSYVVDPAFLRNASGGNSGSRRFIEPPPPGGTLSPVAFEGSPYVAIFETPEFEALMERDLMNPPPIESFYKAGELHKARDALLHKLDELPAKSAYVVTTASESQLEASRLKVKDAYENYRKTRKKYLEAAFDAGFKETDEVFVQMEAEGWFKRGDNLHERYKTDPIFAASFDERSRVARWYWELYLDEAEDRAYRELAARVTDIMNPDTR